MTIRNFDLRNTRFLASVERGRRDEQARLERNRQERMVEASLTNYRASQAAHRGCVCAQCRHS